MISETNARDDEREIAAEYEDESLWSALSLHPLAVVLVGFGLLSVIIGAFALDGVLAGMFGVWGATAIVLGLTGQTLLRVFGVA